MGRRMSYPLRGAVRQKRGGYEKSLRFTQQKREEEKEKENRFSNRRLS